jgi:hypothetical protein
MCVERDCVLVCDGFVEAEGMLSRRCCGVGECMERRLWRGVQQGNAEYTRGLLDVQVLGRGKVVPCH